MNYANQKKTICFITETNRIENPILDPSSRYRCFHRAEELNLEGHICAVYSADQFYKNIDLNFDIYIFHRPTFARPGFESLFNYLKKNNKGLIADYDDLIFGPEEVSIESSAFKNGRISEDNIIKIFHNNLLALKKFEKIVTSTKKLSDYVKKFHSNAEIIVARNIPSISHLNFLTTNKIMLRKRSRNTIGYFCGTASHKLDFEIIENVLCEVLSEDPKKHLLIAGPLEIPESISNLKNISLYSHLDYLHLPYLMSTCTKTIAPLEDTIFNGCKSRVKFLESAISGCRLIASPITDMLDISKKYMDFAISESDWYKYLTADIPETQDTSSNKNIIDFIYQDLKKSAFKEIGVLN